MQKICLADKLAAIRDHWNPRVIAELNGQHVKLVKFIGPFVWHSHEHEDELFLVVRGSFRMELRERLGDPASERSIDIAEGELIVIPRGVEHRPVANAEVDVLLFEPASTLNTGSAADSAPHLTRRTLDRA